MEPWHSPRPIQGVRIHIEFTCGDETSCPLGPDRPTGIPPIPFVGNTREPNTPLVGTRHPDGSFPWAKVPVWEGFGHTWLMGGAGGTCMEQHIRDSLEVGELPPSDILCR